MGKYYVKFGLSKDFNAGSKAMKDIMALLESRGYRVVPSLPAGVCKFFKLFDVPVLLFILLFRVGFRGTVVYFIPSNASRVRFMRFFSRMIGFRLLCFINDIQFMRMSVSRSYAENEIRNIASADVLLVPNESSICILREQYQIDSPMIPVGVWDYLVDDSPSETEGGEILSPCGSVAYAGNLFQAAFLDAKQVLGLRLKVWGSGKCKGNNGFVEFMGEEYPERLVSKLVNCSWGLVWYGSSVDTCSGQLSEYLKFCNSHKCGLYLAAGLPLIVWRESGMRHFVHQYQVGICVSSLGEAASIINSMNEVDYARYKTNAQEVGSKIRRGEFFLRALDKVEELKTE